MMIGPNDMPTRPRTEAECRTYEFVWPHPVGPMPKTLSEIVDSSIRRERRLFAWGRFLAWCWLQIVLICVLWSATGLRDAYLKPAPPAIVRLI